MPVDKLLDRRIASRPPKSQREACALVVRQSLAAVGPCDPGRITIISKQLARGLFGEAFDVVSDQQRERWIGLMEDEYRAAANLSE